MSTDESSSVSTTDFSAKSRISNLTYKSLRRDIRKMTDPNKVIEYLFENEEEMHQIPTRLLNTWIDIKGYHFKRQSGLLRFMKDEKQLVKTLEMEIAELKSIINALILANGLRLPDDIDA